MHVCVCVCIRLCAHVCVCLSTGHGFPGGSVVTIRPANIKDAG